MVFALDSTYIKSSSNQDLRNIVGAFSSNHPKWVATSKYYGTSNSGNSTCCSTSQSQRGWCVEESAIYILHVNETNFAKLGRYWMQAVCTSDFLNVQFNLETITDSTVASFTPWMITSTIFPKKSLRCSTHIFGYFKMDEKFPVIFTRNQMKMLVADVFCPPFQGIKHDMSVTPHIKPYRSWMPRPIKLLSRPEHSAGHTKVQKWLMLL